MIPKFRAFVGNKKMFDIDGIDFYDKTVEVAILDDTGEYIASTAFSFDDVKLMQSTGLKDKNGLKEIFEGDVVKRTSLIPGGSDLVGVVKMLEGCWVIDDGKQAVQLWTEVDKNIVFGNIYENPELLEAKHESE